MFPASIFPPSLFPGAIFPGAGKGALSAGVVALFPASIFPPSLFPSSVYPKGLPLDLLDALEIRLRQLLVVPGLVTWVGPGTLPPGFGLPFVAIGQLAETADYQEDGSGHAPYDDLGEILLMIAASSSSAAKSLSAVVSRVLTDAPLVFSDGTLLLFRRRTRGAPILEDPDAPVGQRTWIAHLGFESIVSRVL